LFFPFSFTISKIKLPFNVFYLEDKVPVLFYTPISNNVPNGWNFSETQI
jgi:hypothetical protein